MINIRTISILILTAILLSSASCDKNADNPDPERYIPTDVDRARCAHINQEAELGGYLYNLCLVNPWPTELPEVEVGGEPVLAAWINDTLAFVAYDPRESMRFNVNLTRDQADESIGLEGHRSTYENIDPSRFSFDLSFDESESIFKGSISDFNISFHALSGRYLVDSALSSISFQKSNGYAFGTFDLVAIDTITNQTITLTDGRFHAPF